MSERQNSSHEHGSEQQSNSHELKARSSELLDEAKKEAAEAKHHHAEKLDEIRNEIEKQATGAKEMSASETKSQEEPEAANTYWNSQEYRDLAFKQFMSKVQKHLTPTEKIGSKLFHQPMVEKASEIGSKTVARPSGVLAGSIFSFITSLATYYFAKQNGYDMTYSIFIVSFIVGFFLGILVEFVFRGTKALLSRD